MLFAFVVRSFFVVQERLAYCRVFSISGPHSLNASGAYLSLWPLNCLHRFPDIPSGAANSSTANCCFILETSLFLFKLSPIIFSLRYPALFFHPWPWYPCLPKPHSRACFIDYKDPLASFIFSFSTGFFLSAYRYNLICLNIHKSK